MKVKRLFWFVMLVMFVLLMSACSPVAFKAAEGDLPPNVLDVILRIALGFASLIGVSQLVAALVQVLKFIGLVKDDTSARWAAGLNLLMFSVLVYFGVFQPQIAMSILDGYAAQITVIILFVLGFVVQITGSKPAYDKLKASDFPLLNFSYSPYKRA